MDWRRIASADLAGGGRGKFWGKLFMQISRVVFSNFRSIRHAEIAPEPSTILIGPNNAGKTAILEAIRIAFTRRWGQRGSGFTEYDVHLCAARPDPKVGDAVTIEIEIHEAAAGEWPEEVQETLLYPDSQHMRLIRYSSEEVEADPIATGIAGIDARKRGEVAMLARTRALLERMQKTFAGLSVPVAIAQRRDDFRSPRFLWLAAALQLAVRPLDRRALDALTGAFNRWFDTAIWSDNVAAAAEISSRSLLLEWANAAASIGNDTAKGLAALALDLATHPTTFREFLAHAIACFPQDESDASSDVAEDRAAWGSLIRSIGKAIGHDAPLEQFLQELALRSKEWLCLSYADRYRGRPKQPSRFLTEMGLAIPPAPAA